MYLVCLGVKELKMLINLQVWKRKWFVLRRKSPQGKARLEYYSSERSCTEGRNRTIITLDGITEIVRAQSRTHVHPIQIVSKEVKIFLAGDDEQDSQEWLKLMKELVLPEPKMFPSIEGGDIYGKKTLLSLSRKDSKNEEQNKILTWAFSCEVS